MGRRERGGDRTEVGEKEQRFNRDMSIVIDD